MTLATVVTARVSNERLVQLSNPDTQTPSTVDATRLAAACSDAEGEFQVYTGAVFDEADPRHVAPAVDLVVLILKERGAAPAATIGSERERIIKRLRDVGKVTGRNRIMPETARDTAETFQDSAFHNTLIDPQGSGEEDEDA